MLGRALQMIDSTGADFVWLFENDIYFGETGESVRKLVRHYENDTADLIMRNHQNALISTNF